MLVYIAGLNSTKKNWIDLKLKELSNNTYSYFLLNDDIPNLTEETVILAHSMGCLSAMQLWSKFPDKIKTIQLINPTNQIFDFDFDFKSAPITIHLGEKDEVLNIPRLYNDINLNYIKLITYKDLSHRFDETQFDELLSNIEPYLNIV